MSEKLDKKVIFTNGQIEYYVNNFLVLSLDLDNVYPELVENMDTDTLRVLLKYFIQKYSECQKLQNLERQSILLNLEKFLKLIG
jgi:hypothetical protein